MPFFFNFVLQINRILYFFNHKEHKECTKDTKKHPAMNALSVEKTVFRILHAVRYATVGTS